jgi:hypothetical protein
MYVVSNKCMGSFATIGAQNCVVLKLGPIVHVVKAKIVLLFMGLASENEGMS